VDLGFLIAKEAVPLGEHFEALAEDAAGRVCGRLRRGGHLFKEGEHIFDALAGFFVVDFGDAFAGRRGVGSISRFLRSSTLILKSSLVISTILLKKYLTVAASLQEGKKVIRSR
jgi:hypothetical protein